VLPYVTLVESLSPVGEPLQAVLDPGVVGQVVGITGKGVNRRQRVALRARHQQRRSGEILVMPLRQAPTFSISVADCPVGTRHAAILLRCRAIIGLPELGEKRARQPAGFNGFAETFTRLSALSFA
jgi:hypothetical protein